VAYRGQVQSSCSCTLAQEELREGLVAESAGVGCRIASVDVGRGGGSVRCGRGGGVRE